MRFYRVFEHDPEDFFPDYDTSFRKNEQVLIEEPEPDNYTVYEVLPYDIPEDVVNTIIEEYDLNSDDYQNILDYAIEDGYVKELYPYDILPPAEDISENLIIEYEFVKHIGYAVNIKSINYGYQYNFKTDQDIPYRDHTYTSNYIVTDTTKTEINDIIETGGYDDLREFLAVKIEEYVHYPIQKGFDSSIEYFVDFERIKRI